MLRRNREELKPRAGAGSRARLALGALLAALLIAPAHAGGAVSVTVEDGEGSYHVKGAFKVPVPASVAWDVLTDYDHIGQFVKSVRASEADRQGVGWLLLRQDARGGFFPFQRTVHVRLDVREEADSLIRFRDVLAKDFHHYEGQWLIRVGWDETEVSYALDARPTAAMPHGFGCTLMGHEAKDLLEQVRAEMIRRSNPTPAPEGGGR
ncbi:MAG TPA: SRPBCC family protein [Gemmatimonadaceae bacterium]|jgi:hypothetical protein|nr:SRPBCC family protein [Gemmatimonadaceae bacterium]